MNYIIAELRIREVENLALAEANRKDASEESLIGGENNDEVRVGDVEMEDLADRVTDARIDIQQDHAVDTLMEGLSRL